MPALVPPIGAGLAATWWIASSTGVFFQKLDVVRLVAAGDEQRLGVADACRARTDRGGLAVLEDDRLDRVAAAQVEDVLVVLVGCPRRG